MTKRTTFLTRFLAMALALALCASNVMPGLALRASAAEGITQTEAQMLSGAYWEKLSPAEQALLGDTLLKSESHVIPALNKDGLVEVKDGVVTAKDDGNWKVAGAGLMVGQEWTDIEMVNGVGSFETEAPAYTVIVNYNYYQEIGLATQEKLLNAHATLKQGVANLEAGKATNAQLDYVKEIIPTLADLMTDADAVELLKIEDAVETVNALNAQISANGGVLAMQAMNNAYAASNAYAYLKSEGVAYKEEAANTAALMTALNNSGLMNNEKLDEMLAEQVGSLWDSFKGCVAGVAATLSEVSAADWSGIDLIADDGVNYDVLKQRVEKITATSDVALVESLPVFVDAVEVKSENAVNVNIVIKIRYTEENEVVTSDIYDVTNSVAVAKGSTAAEVLATLNTAEGEAVAKNMTWNGIYVEGQFDRTASTLPEVVNEDVTYTITYSPKEYEVTYIYDETTTETRPYGYVISLPAAEEGSYDYYINSSEEVYAGTEYTVEGKTTIERISNTVAYTPANLYEIVGKNIGNDVDLDILTSGALEGNKNYNVRIPTQEHKMTLEEGVLSAPAYSSGRYGEWMPNRFGAKDAEDAALTPFASGETTASCNVGEAQVVYRLSLPDDASEIPAMLKYIKEQSVNAQGALNRLAGDELHGQMYTISMAMLAGLQFSIPKADLTPGDGTADDADNSDLREYFNDLIKSILNENFNAENLKLYDLIDEYKSEGLGYYYRPGKAEEIRAEVADLSAKLQGLVGDEQKEVALGILIKLAKADEKYVERIGDLGSSMAEISDGLAMDVKYIDRDSADLNKLAAILAKLKAEDVKENALPAGAPYMETTLTVRNSSYRAVSAKVYVNGTLQLVYPATEGVLYGNALPAGSMEKLVADVQKVALKAIDNTEDFSKAVKYPYYICSVEGSANDGDIMTENVTLVYKFTPVKYTVNVEGMEPQTIDVEDREIDLALHVNHPGVTYEYTVGNNTAVTSSKYIFEIEDLKNLFDSENSYSISRVENKKNQEQFETRFEDLNPNYDSEGNLAGLNPDQALNGDGLMEMAKVFITAKYNYIELNDTVFMELAKSAEGENSMQVHMNALVKAMLGDAGFGSERLIALAKGEEKTLIDTTINVRNSQDTEMFENLAFVWTPESIPEQMVTVGNALNAVREYLSFKSAGDGKTMNVTLNLPDPVYEVYLTALLVTGNLDKTDVNAMNNQIAFRFFADYLEKVVQNEDITADTYENTLNMMIREFNEIADKEISTIEVSKYKNHYEALRRALNGERVTYNFYDDNALVEVQAYGKDMNAIINAMGIDLGGYENMVYELNYPDTLITTYIKATLEDAAESKFQAALVDLANHGGKKETAAHIYDFTNNLVKRAASLKGETAIMLLDNITGDLNIAQSGIIDLNGKTLTGNLNFTGRKLIIVDSCQDTTAAGCITGTIKGDVVILAGKYNANVDSFLRDGYYKDSDNFVKNALYTVEGGIYNIDTDKLFDENYVEGYLPAVHYMAAEIAIDMALNYYTAASLSAENYDLYAISFDDIVGMLGTDSNKGKVGNLLNDLLGMFRFEGPNGEPLGGIDGFINQVIADLTDFSAIAAAVESGNKVVDYTFTTHPWSVAIDHVDDAGNDYMTVGIVPNEKITDQFTLGVSFSGANKDKTLRYLNELARIVEKFDVMIDLHQPEIISDELQIGGGAVADIVLDFSHNCDYNRMLAAVLAFAHEDLTEEFVKNGCIMDLNDILAEITVGDFFTAIKKAVEAKEWDFAALAAKAGVELTDAQVQKLNEYYDKFRNGAGKVLSKLELKTEAMTPMSELSNPELGIGSGVFVVDGYIGEKHPDASYRGYGVQFNLEKVDVKLTVKLAPKCNGLWGDANRDGKVNYRDVVLLCRYVGTRITEDKLHLCVMDLNGDNIYNYRDIVLLVRFVGERINKFPVEN